MNLHIHSSVHIETVCSRTLTGLAAAWSVGYFGCVCEFVCLLVNLVMVSICKYKILITGLTSCLDAQMDRNGASEVTTLGRYTNNL